MKNIIEALTEKYKINKQIVLYLFFGVCTTIINTVCYWLLYEVLTMNNIVSTIVAWFIAVIFAFITNKVYVFKSQRTSPRKLLSEVISFFGCRLLTGILDVAIMVVAVDLLKWNSLLWKLISNIIVTIINYIASKKLVFRKNTK